MDEELERIRKEKMKKRLERKRNPIIEVNDENFQEKVLEQSEKIPIVVDFWSVRCMPCLILSPKLERLVREYNGKFILAKVNVDEAMTISQIYGIRSIPSVKLFKKRKVVDEFIGALPEPYIRKWLEKNLGK